MTTHVHEWKPVECECGGYDPVCARERKCECGAETLAPWCEACDGEGCRECNGEGWREP